MFLWRSLNPQAVLAVFGAFSKAGSADPIQQPKAANDGRNSVPSAARIDNPYDPNSLT